MITDDEVLRLFERADPARGDDAAPVIDAVGDLERLRTRSIDVNLIDIDRPATEPTKLHRWPIIAAAAAAAVVLILGGAIVFAAQDDPPETTAAARLDAAAVEVATGFLHAYVANDADRAMTYLSDTALDEMFGGAEGLRLGLRFNEAQPYRQTIGDCEQRDDSAAGVSLRCPFSFHAIRSDELGLGPYIDNYWEFTIRDGKIVSAEEYVPFGDNGFNDQMWTPFANWVRKTYPDDILVMYGDANATSTQITEESIRLWEQRTREYVTTRDAFIARADAICTAARGRLDDQLTAAGMETRDDDGLEYERSAAGVLDQTVPQLRAVPAPEAFRAEFDHGYTLVEQLAQALRGTGTDTVTAMDQIAQVGLGLYDCTFALQR